MATTTARVFAWKVERSDCRLSSFYITITLDISSSSGTMTGRQKKEKKQMKIAKKELKKDTKKNVKMRCDERLMRD